MVQLSFFTIITALVACGLAAPHRHHFGQTSNSTSVSTPPSSISPIAPASSSLSSSSTSSTTTAATGSIDANLVPDFGITAGVASSTPNNCVGNNGVLIPCTCPPDRDAFVQKVGEAVAGGAAFPEDSSATSAVTRLQTCIVELQNFVGGPGSGVGCPAAATTWVALLSQLQSTE